MIGISSEDLEITVVEPKGNWIYKPATEVKIKHKETGFAVRCNSTKSQHKNKFICLSYIESYVRGLRNV